nr:MAG: RNA-dependent RNA polymerase [Crogonang virus 138]
MREFDSCLAVTAAAVGACTRETAADYISSRTGSKRAIYAHALRRLQLFNQPIGALARIKYFVKREATVWSKTQVPRIISPRSVEFNLLLGRYLRPAEHKIFDGLRQLFGDSLPVIAKGLTQQAKGAAIVSKLEKYGCCIGLDASRFDQSVTKPLLKLEHSLYKMLYPGDRKLTALLDAQLLCSGTGMCHDGMVTAKVPSMRCSGDVNTSLGNCVLSAFMARRFLAHVGVEGTIFCDGDDVLLFVPPSAVGDILLRLPSWYLQWGFRMKVEAPAYEPEQVEFCQARPVCVDGEWTLVRNFAKALNTDGFVYQTLTHEQRMVHLRAVGLCGLSMAAGVPILQAFYKALVASGKTGKFDDSVLGNRSYQQRIQVAAGYLARARPVVDDTRVSFFKAFGVSPEDQIIMETVISADYSRTASDIQSLCVDKSLGCTVSQRYTADHTLNLH